MLRPRRVSGAVHGALDTALRVSRDGVVRDRPDGRSEVVVAAGAARAARWHTATPRGPVLALFEELARSVELVSAEQRGA